MSERTETTDKSRSSESALKLLLCVFSELMWFVRRAPVLLLMFITWYALDVSSDKNQILMAVCAYGYFAVHHYLKWIENRYE